MEEILFKEKYEIIFEMDGLRLFVKLQFEPPLNYVVLARRSVRFKGKWEGIFQIEPDSSGLDETISKKLLIRCGNGAEGFNVCSDMFFRVILNSIALNGLNFSDETLGIIP